MHEFYCRVFVADHLPNLTYERSLARFASISRFFLGEFVSREFSISCAAAATRSTASENATSFACEGLFIPESLRTNCKAEAFTSSVVAGGSKLNRVLILRHIDYWTSVVILPVPIARPDSLMPKICPFSMATGFSNTISTIAPFVPGAIGVVPGGRVTTPEKPTRRM